MAIEPFNQDPLAMMNRIFGVAIKEHTLATDKANDIVSHDYENQFKTIEDVEKIKMPVIVHDKAETRRRMDMAAWIFDGLMPLRQEGGLTIIFRSGTLSPYG
jgi:phage gp36-like protein